MSEIVHKILNDLQLSHLFEEFEKQGVDDEAVKSLSKEDLIGLLPGIGHRTKFFMRLQAELIEKVAENADESLNNTTCTEDSFPDTVVLNVSSDSLHSSKRKLDDSVETPRCSSKRLDMKMNSIDDLKSIKELSKNLKFFLGASYDGQSVIKSYVKNNELLPEYRKKLVEVLAKQMIELSNDALLTKGDFTLMSDAIVELFPKERKEIYHSPSAVPGKPARGKLFDKYHYLRKIYSKSGVITPLRRCNAMNICRPVNDDTVNNQISWLKFDNREPWGQVVEFWGATSKSRRASFLDESGKPVYQIMKEWPVLKDPRANGLIEIDFHHIYPGKEDILLSTWEELSDKLIKLALKSKAINVPECLTQVEGAEDIDKDYRNLLVLQLLPHLCKPNGQFKSKTTKKFWKPTSVESMEGFILIVESNHELETMVFRIREKKAHLGLNVQPFVIVIIENKKMKSAFVDVDGVYYELPSLIKAVDVCFKSFQTLNAKYPFESQQIWAFFQKHVYDIDTPWDSNFPNSVWTLISGLKNL